jgi:hypothetical protein
MTTAFKREFVDSVATRVQVPLLIGLSGPSGGGKTFSALRLASGIQRVCGGDIGVIDTEARRALHYAEKFRFRHVPFGAPFSPLDYLAAIEHCAAKGIKTVVVDSMSHEHEGPGGVLETHDAEVERMAGSDFEKAKRVTMSAWIKPKSERRRLLNCILQMPLNFIFCFRAKEKIKVVRGRDPVELGWMPIAGEEFVFEMTAVALLPSGANGKPDWNLDSGYSKLPEQFRELFLEPRALDESHGEGMAKWAASGAPATAAVAPGATLLQLTDTLKETGLRTKESVLAWINGMAAGKKPGLLTPDELSNLIERARMGEVPATMEPGSQG